MSLRSLFSLWLGALCCACPLARAGDVSVPAADASASPVPAVALLFSPDGQSLLVSGRQSVLIRSVASNAPVTRAHCAMPKITSIAFHPKGELLAVAGGVPGRAGQVQLFDWKRRQPIATLSQGADLINAIAFSPDGGRLAAAGGDASVEIYSVSEREPFLQHAASLGGHAGPVLAAAYSPNGQTLVTAGADRSLKVWHTATGQPLRSFNRHTSAVHCLAFRPDFASPLPDSNSPAPARPPFCASGGDDQTVRIWQPSIGRMVRIVRHHSGPIFALVHNRDGTSLFSAGGEGIIRRIDAASDAIQQQWRAHEDWIYSLALSPDGRILASGDWTGSIRLWDAETGLPLPFSER